MLMIRPPRPRASIAPPMSFVHRNVLVRFRSRISSHLSSGSWSVGTLIAPAADVVDQDVDRAEFGHGLFAGRLAGVELADVGFDRKGLPPQAANLVAAVVETLSASRATRTTSAPASAIASAISRPKPRLPPVMNSRFPSSRNRSRTPMVFSFRFVCLDSLGRPTLLSPERLVKVDPLVTLSFRREATMSISHRAALAALILFYASGRVSLAEGDAKNLPARRPAAEAPKAKPRPRPKPTRRRNPTRTKTDKPAAEPAVILPGHSMHGEAFDEGPRQRAYLMGTAGSTAATGGVHFPITTKDPLAQQFFDQGVGQLHGFWYFEAERSFRQVLKLDAECAMAYWGLAMANINNEKRAKSFIAKAMAKKAGATPREIAWIEALAASYDGKDTVERRRKYIRDLEAIVQSDPNDVEAKAFLVFQIWKNGSWMTESKKQLPISSHQAVDALLDQILLASPMHPAHHYRIHLWDEEKPARALVSASLCGQTSPLIAHMWHMPGHTFSKLHRYADAAWQQEASARVDHAHMMRDGVLPDQIHNYAHNNEWLIRDLAHVGRVRDAIDLATNMIDLPRHPKYNTAERSGTSAGYGLKRLVEVLAQYECWPEIVAYHGTPYFETPATPDEKLKRARLLGVAWFGQGNVAEGQKQLAVVDELLKEKRLARYKAADEAETKARGDKKSEADVAKAMADVLASHAAGVRARSNMPWRSCRATRPWPPASPRPRARSSKSSKRSTPIRKDHLARAFSLSGDHAQAETLARASG